MYKSGDSSKEEEEEDDILDKVKFHLQFFKQLDEI